jgi:predicted PurR-regulated permease PerM
MEMNPVAILVVVFIGGAVGGLYGMILCIPLAACVKIYLEADLWPRYRDWREGKRSDFLPIE